MEEANSFEEKKEKIEKKVEKRPQQKIYKIMKNKSKNYLLNVISFLIYNKNNFEEKLKPSDFDIILEMDSNNSTYKKIKYKTNLKNASFNPKRDLNKNIKLYNSMPCEIEMKDEYYKVDLDNINVDIFPKIRKGINLDISQFPLCSYENKKINYDIKDEIKKNLNCEENEYILCIYICDLTKSIDDAFQMIESVFEIDMFEQYFKSTFIIFQATDENNLNKFYNNETINKYLNQKDKKKMMILFNLLSNYGVNEANKDNLINILNQKDRRYSLLLQNEEWEKLSYFFILDNNKKIVKIKKFTSIFKNMGSLLLKLKQSKKTGDNTPYFKKKEKAHEEKLKQAEELIQFISNIPKMDLNYIFDIVFKISLVLNPNDELTDLRIKKINRIDIEAEFFTKEYKYLNQLCDSLKLSNCKFELTELKTIDVDIDFTNMECGKCKNVIPENAYLYYCFICKIKYCWDCVQDKLKNNKGKAKYIDEKHHLIFFKTRDKEQFLNLEESKLGHNHFAEFDENKLTRWDSTRCNGCGSSVGREMERYVCLHCRKGKKMRGGFIDYCSECIDEMCKDKVKMREKEKKSDEVVSHWNNSFFEGLNFKVEHKHEEHIYLMMPYQISTSVENEYYFF